MSVVGENGALQVFKISDSTRSNIGNCVMYEMERYFQDRKRSQGSEGYRGHGDTEYIIQSTGDDTHSGGFCDEHPEGGPLQWAKPHQTRATLPDEWLTERIRAQQA